MLEIYVVQGCVGLDPLLVVPFLELDFAVAIFFAHY
jgi:hypothetical protein